MTNLASKYFENKDFKLVSSASKTKEQQLTPTGCPNFEVKLPQNQEEIVVSATEFGLDESRDNCGEALNKALEHCKKIGATKLILGKGTYKCFDPQGIVIKDFENFTLDGQGAKLIFRRESDFSKRPLQYESTPGQSNITIKNCRRIKIKNLKIDWDWEISPLAAFVKILDKHIDDQPGHSYLDVEFLNYEKYPFYPSPVPIHVLTPMDESLERFSDHGLSMFFGGPDGHYGTKSEWLAPNKLRIYPAVRPDDAPFSEKYVYPYERDKDTNRRQTDEVANVGKNYRLTHHYYGKNCFNLDSNEHLTLKDIDIYSCRGMGMHIDGSQKYSQFININVAPPVDVKIRRPCTTTADVVHVARSCGFCKVIGCNITLNQDDIFNFHDRTSFFKKISERKMEIVGGRGMNYFNAQPGDKLELFDCNVTPIDFLARVVSVDEKILELDKAIPEPKEEGFLAANRSYETANILIKDCNFRNHYGRMIIVTNRTTIDNCLFQNGTDIPIRLVSLGYTKDKWSEGAGCSNIVVRNCVFDHNNVIYNDSDRNGLIYEIFSGARVCNQSGFLKPCNGAIRDILIENNEFKNISGLSMIINSGKNIIFRNNTFRQASEQTNNKCFPDSVLVNNGEDISLEENE